MTSLHMETETVFAEAKNMQHSGEFMELQLQALHIALHALESAWKGGNQADFSLEAELLLEHLKEEGASLNTMARRVQKEAQKWETLDQDGAARWREASMNGALPWLIQQGMLPGAGGGWTVPTGLRAAPVLPLMTAVSIGNLRQSLPKWLKGRLNQLFPPASIVPPRAKGAKPTTPALKTPPKTMPAATATPSAEPRITASPVYDVPVKSQGALYGNAACAPTAISMVLDYFHAKDPANPTATPEQIIAILDKGDGTPGVGMSLSKVSDELNDLGYKNVLQSVNNTMLNLEKKLMRGPVIVTTGVKLKGPGTAKAIEPRAIEGPGNTIHAMVVKGVTAVGVVVNDPWTGSEMTLPVPTFQEMWKRGLCSMYTIQR